MTAEPAPDPFAGDVVEDKAKNEVAPLLFLPSRHMNPLVVDKKQQVINNLIC